MRPIGSGGFWWPVQKGGLPPTTAQQLLHLYWKLKWNYTQKCGFFFSKHDFWKAWFYISKLINSYRFPAKIWLLRQKSFMNASFYYLSFKSGQVGLFVCRTLPPYQKNVLHPTYSPTSGMGLILCTIMEANTKLLASWALWPSGSWSAGWWWTQQGFFFLLETNWAGSGCFFSPTLEDLSDVKGLDPDEFFQCQNRTLHQVLILGHKGPEELYVCLQQEEGSVGMDLTLSKRLRVSQNTIEQLIERQRDWVWPSMLLDKDPFLFFCCCLKAIWPAFQSHDFQGSYKQQINYNKHMVQRSINGY